MALTANHKDISFGVGDTIRITQKITEGEKERLQAFEGIVIGIKGRTGSKSFIVRKIGVQQVGIERIFPLDAPTIEKIEVLRHGTEGSRHAKLYFIREKSKREIEQIYSRSTKKAKVKEAKAVQSRKSSSKKAKSSTKK